MRMIDITGNTVSEYDKNLYYLVEENLLIQHHPQKDITKDSHKHTLATWNEYEKVLRVTAFTDSQLLDPKLMENLRHKSEKTSTKTITDKERIAQLELEINELKNLINNLQLKE